MHSQHFLAAAEHVYFRKTPEFVVFRFGLSQGNAGSREALGTSMDTDNLVPKAIRDEIDKKT
jgi:hypothetical protein